MKIGTMFYAPGHVDKRVFISAIWAHLSIESKDELDSTYSQVKHRYMRETTTPSGIVRTIYTKPGQGAKPITVLDLGYDE